MTEFIYPDYCEIPRDSEDVRFTKSFDVINDTQIAVDFFNQFGFVVVKNIFSDEECKQTREGMWKIIEKAHEGFDRNDTSTWESMKSTGKYGLSTRGPCFDELLLRNRQNPLLATVLADIISTPLKDLMVSHDRFTIYRATVSPDGSSDGLKYSTGRRNVHLDLNPWWWLESSTDILTGKETLTYEDPQDFIRENNMVVRSMGRHVQCVMNFKDNIEDDGGTIVVPKFHHHVVQWCASHLSLKQKLPWLTFPDIKSSGNIDSSVGSNGSKFGSNKSTFGCNRSSSSIDSNGNADLDTENIRNNNNVNDTDNNTRNVDNKHNDATSNPHYNGNNGIGSAKNDEISSSIPNAHDKNETDDNQEKNRKNSYQKFKNKEVKNRDKHVDKVVT